MAMLKYFEESRPKLESLLRSAKSEQDAVKAVEDELDRLLLLHNESCEDAQQREAAAVMLRAVKLSLPVIREQAEPAAADKKSALRALLVKLLPALSVLCCLMSFLIALFIERENFRAGNVIAAVLLAAAALALSRLSGTLGKAEVSFAGDTPFRADVELTCGSLHTLIADMDRSLQEFSDLVQTSSSEEADDKPLIDLLANLLEASCSGDGQYALDLLGDVRYYLHRCGIEAVDYDGKNNALFDFMPGSGVATLRPALVRDGETVKKGLASR